MRYPKGYLSPPVPRFLAMLQKADGDACWVWTGFRLASGYGQIRVNGRNMLAHRFAWVIANGPIPEGMEVCHRCDNPPCARADHLFLGTRGQNAGDAVAKGRSSHGEARWSAKLTDAQVAEIRARYTGARGEQTQLAREYGITQPGISEIVHDKRWRH